MDRKYINRKSSLALPCPSIQRKYKRVKTRGEKDIIIFHACLFYKIARQYIRGRILELLFFRLLMSRSPEAASFFPSFWVTAFNLYTNSLTNNINYINSLYNYNNFFSFNWIDLEKLWDEVECFLRLLFHCLYALYLPIANHL